MEEFQTLVPDRETFLRVWRRVMPDDSNSPIAITPPEPAQSPQPQRGQAARVQQPEPQMEEVRTPDWEELLRTMDEGLAGSGEIQRRVPGAWPLGESLRRSANQVRSAYFLQTGRRWRQGPGQVVHREGLDALLRQQYIWEIRWSDLCRRAARGMGEADAREIFPELERESRRRRGMIRNLLART